MTKKKDLEMEALTECFLQYGWKKNGYQIYKYMDKEKKYIVSSVLNRGGYLLPSGVLNAKLSFHHVDLNEFSNFIRQFNKIEPPDIGLFNGFKIPMSLQLRGWDSLPLSATIKTFIHDGPDDSAFVSLCDQGAEEMYDKYKNVESLADLYESEERWKDNKDILIINLYLKRYAKVRELFKNHFGPDGRAMTFVIDYMDRYGLR
jgi:hypothetical protein